MHQEDLPTNCYTDLKVVFQNIEAVDFAGRFIKLSFSMAIALM
jgi:hypothetical protein